MKCSNSPKEQNLNAYVQIHFPTHSSYHRSKSPQYTNSCSMAGCLRSVVTGEPGVSTASGPSSSRQCGARIGPLQARATEDSFDDAGRGAWSVPRSGGVSGRPVSLIVVRPSADSRCVPAVLTQEVPPMALSQSVASELLEAFRAGEGVDLIRESVQLVMQELIKRGERADRRRPL